MPTRKTEPRQKQWTNRIVSQGQEPPEQLLANPLNWRVHPQFQQEAVGQALDAVGWIQNVVVNEVTGHVIDGHLRVSLAISRGEKSVPVSYVKLSPDEERLALATFDPLGALAVGDPGVLRDLLKEVEPYTEEGALSELLLQLRLQTEALQIGDITPADEALQPPLSEHDAEELDRQAKELTGATPDRMEQIRAKWGVAVGQKWRIASHQMEGSWHHLLVGDCAAKGVMQDVVAYINGSKKLLVTVVTSPPYDTGQIYEKGDEWAATVNGFLKQWAPISKALFVNLADVVVPKEKPGREEHSYGYLVSQAEKFGVPLVSTRIWRKDPTWMGANSYWINSYKPVHEFEYLGLFADLTRFYSPDVGGFKRPSERLPESEDWRFRGVWDVKSVASQAVGEGHHPAAFPVELPRRCILLLTDPGEVVADPFLGSGTTMVAAERLGRPCVGVERDPAFAAVALERLSQMGLHVEQIDG